MIHEQRQAEQLVLAGRHMPQGAIFQDIDAGLEKYPVRLAEVVRLLEMADGDVVQADEDDPFGDEVFRGGDIEVDIVLDKLFAFVGQRRVARFEEQPLAFLDVVLFQLGDLDFLRVFNLDNARRADGRGKGHIAYRAAAGDEVEGRVDMRAGVGNHFQDGHRHFSAERHIMVTVNFGGEGIGGEVAHPLLERDGDIVPAFRYFNCHEMHLRRITSNQVYSKKGRGARVKGRGEKL